MPSPLGHALGGIAASWQLLPSEARRRHFFRAVAAVALLGVAPDFDLLVNDHRGLAHSLGAALLAGILTLICSRRLRWGAAVSAAWGSHILLDWLGTDTRPPIGVMALWPLARNYFESSAHLFPAISRRYWLTEFWTYNLKAAIVELCILGPLTLIVMWPNLRFSWRRSNQQSFH